MAQLQDIVKKLETESESLEDSLKLFEEGTKLSLDCYNMLKEAEQKVTELSSINDR